MKISIPVSFGEVLDKITILEIKEEHFTYHNRDQQKLSYVQDELNALEAALDQASIQVFTSDVQLLYIQLDRINRLLWKVEDKLREMETASDFGTEFVEAARSVYKLNDDRAIIKAEINKQLGSAIVEVKSYVS